jgi:ferritin-like metal-binding protein YciE
MAKEPKKLDDLFHDTLKDIYFAEKKILTALPKMAKAAHSEDFGRPSRSITAKPKARWKDLKEFST